MKIKTSLHNFLLAAGSSLLAVSSASASTWDGSESGSWANALNWDLAPTLTGDDLIFTGPGNLTSTNDAGVTSINSLTLGTTATPFWNIALGTLSIGGGGISSAGTATLSGTLTLGAAQTWTNSTGTLNVNGTVNNASYLLTIGGAGNSTITSKISGTGGLRKIDAGVLNLGDAAGSGNDYSGGFTLDGGVVQLATGGLLNTAFGTGTLTINTGTIRTSSGGTIVTNNNSVWNGITSLQRSGSGTGTWIHNGNITLNASIAPTTTAGGFVLDVRGNIGETGGPRSITVGNRQTMIFSGNNTYTGNTTVNGGTNPATLIARSATALGTGGTRNVTVGTGADLIYAAAADAALSISGTLAITGGAGTLIGASIGSSLDSAKIAVTGAASITNAAHTINIYGVNGVTTRSTGTYTLISGGSGSSLNPATAPTLGTIYNNTNFAVGAFVRTATELKVDITSAPALTAAYWKGGLTGATSVWAASSTTASNWVADIGGTATALVPGPDADVFISATTVTTAPTASTLGADMTIKSLTISDNTNNFALNADGYALTVGSGGITKNNTTTKTATIGANLVLGAAQTWSNSDTGNALAVSGAVSGANNLIVTGAGNTTISGSIKTGAGTLTKQGAGTLTLSGTNTYIGATTVSDGKLIVNGSISTSVLTTVSNNATLGGTGTVGAATIQSTGILAPGDGGIESLNTAALTLGLGSISNFEINTAGDISDLAVSSALLTFGGTLNVSNIGGALVDGDIFNLFDWVSTSGAFSSLNLPALDTGLSWNTSSLYTAGTIAVIAIPEPRAALLGAIGILALLRRRRN